MTIAWSMGLSALVPMAAHAQTCPTLNVGDLVKADTSNAVYYVGAGSKRYYAPTGETLLTWVDDYTAVKTVPAACVEALANAGGLGFRPGSRLVKVPAFPSVYAVGPNNMKHKLATADVAAALYGANWGKLVRDLADVFDANYTVGSEITEAAPHNGQLVKTASSADVYHVVGGKLQKVSGTLSKASMSDVRTVSDTVFGKLAMDTVTATPAAVVANPTQRAGADTGAGTTPVTPTTGSVSVSLASDTPFATTLVSDTADGAQAYAPVLKVNFTAGSDADAKVTTLKLKRGGISADTDISNMHLYDGDTRLASNPSISGNMVTFTNASGLLTVPKGTTKTVTVKLDLKNNVTGGKTLNFAVADAASVTLGSGLTAGGTFPVTGNTFTTASVTDLGKLDFTSSAPSAAGTVDPGTAGFEIWRLQAADTDQDIELRKLTVTIVGSVNSGDLTNLSLWDGSTQIGSTVAALNSDKTVTFDLMAAPYVITKGQTKILSVKADISGGTNRTFRASLQNGFDAVTYDKNYGVFLKTDGTDSFAIIQPNSSGTAVDYTVNAGSLTQTLASDSPTGNIPDGATNVTFAKFLWKANGEDIKISSLSVSTTASTATRTIANLRLLVDGSQVGSTISSHTSGGAADTGFGTFGNSFIIKAGKTAVVSLVGDTTASATAAADTYIAGFPAGSSNGQGVVSLTTISTVAQTANTLTVRSGTVSVANNTSFGNKTASNPTGTVNASQVKVASLVVTAGSGEAVDLSQVTLRDNTTSDCIGDYLQNLTLKNAAGTQLATTYANPSGTCTTQNSYTFNLSPAVNVLSGSQYVIDVYADLKASLTTATALIDVNTVTATGKTTGTSATADSQDLALQNVYIAASGALMVQVDSDTPVANNHLMGATDTTIGKFQVTASSTEAINITQLVLSARFSTGATGTVTNIRLLDNDTGAAIGTAVPSFSDTVAGTSSPTSTYSHATFSGLSFQVPKGSSKTILVKADFSTYEGAGFSTTGQTVAPAVLRIYTGTSGNNPVTATGASSGTSLTATISNSGSTAVTGGGNNVDGGIGAFAATTTLYRAKLRTAWASDTASGSSSPSATQTVAKFVVTNTANSGSYVATVERINFDISSTISNTATRALNVYKDALTTTALATTNINAGQLENFGDTAITDGNFTNVDISSGASKTFYVTLDTTNAASTKSLSIRVGSSDIEWTDGVTSDLTVMDTDLPLLYKTFTY